MTASLFRSSVWRGPSPGRAARGTPPPEEKCAIDGREQTTWRAPLPSESKGFPDLGSPESAVDDFVKKSKKVGKIDPEPTVQTARIQPPVHERVVALNHHEPFALKTIHRKFQGGLTGCASPPTPGTPPEALRRKSSC